MHLSRAAASPLHSNLVYLTPRHFHGLCTFAESFEVDGQRAFTIGLSENADPVTDAGGERAKLGLGCDSVAGLEFRGRHEAQSHSSYQLQLRTQFQFLRWHLTPQERCSVEEPRRRLPIQI